MKKEHINTAALFVVVTFRNVAKQLPELGAGTARYAIVVVLNHDGI
jgi:hypothetical protein